MSNVDAPCAPGTSRTDILITDGPWRLQKFTHHKGYYYCIAHYCTAGRSGSPFKGWVGMFFYMAAIRPCYVCNTLPPDGLQGAFIMMDWENV